MSFVNIATVEECLANDLVDQIAAHRRRRLRCGVAVLGANPEEVVDALMSCGGEDIVEGVAGAAVLLGLEVASVV